MPAQQAGRGAAKPGWRAGATGGPAGRGQDRQHVQPPTPACLHSALASCCPPALSQPRAGPQPPPSQQSGLGQVLPGRGWQRPSCPLAPRVGVLLLYFCLFLPPCCLCHAPPHPALPARPPALQPTDERSWVYSPLHYSVQAHPASDGESDTVSAPTVRGARAGAAGGPQCGPQMPRDRWGDRPGAEGQAACSPALGRPPAAVG